MLYNNLNYYIINANALVDLTTLTTVTVENVNWLIVGRGGRVVRYRIAMLEVASSNRGRGKINLQK